MTLCIRTSGRIWLGDYSALGDPDLSVALSRSQTGPEGPRRLNSHVWYLDKKAGSLSSAGPLSLFACPFFRVAGLMQEWPGSQTTKAETLKEALVLSSAGRSSHRPTQILREGECTPLLSDRHAKKLRLSLIDSRTKSAHSPFFCQLFAHHLA